MYLCMLAWIMDMFLLFNSIVYMLSCVIVHVLARALIYLLVWWHGNTHTHIAHRRWNRNEKAVGKDEKLKSKDWICAMSEWSEVNFSYRRQMWNERTTGQTIEWVCERTSKREPKQFQAFAFWVLFRNTVYFFAASSLSSSSRSIAYTCVCSAKCNVERRYKTKRIRNIANLWDPTYWINFFAPQCHGTLIRSHTNTHTLLSQRTHTRTHIPPYSIAKFRIPHHNSVRLAQRTT